MKYVTLVCDCKKGNLGGGTRCEEGVNIRGQSYCGIWSGEYQLEVHLGDGPWCVLQSTINLGSNKLALKR